VSTKVFLEYSLFAELIVASIIVAIMARKSLIVKFPWLTAFLGVTIVSTTVSILTLYFRARLLGIPPRTAYNVFAATSWTAGAVQFLLVLLVIYGVFNQAMKPLQGLHRAGKVVFRWVYGVSLALVLGMAIGPHLSSGSYISTVTGQIQQGISVLTLCLLLFVCFATRYLGLTFRSHIFGVSLGLGIWAMVSLVETAWYSSIAAASPYSAVYLFSALGSCAALVTWGTYFALPEPERKMVLLPTTSPFFLWNRISEALGDEPGFVAIAGFKPDMLAPAELSVLKAASKRVREQEAAANLAEANAQSMQLPLLAMHP
jgi:hypothetical protein